MTEAILVEIYPYIYLAICFILVISKTFAKKTLISPEDSTNSLYKALIIGIIFIFFFGLRPWHGFVMGDTWAYAGGYEAIRKGAHAREFTNEVAWEFLMQTMANLNCSVSMWFCVIAAIYILFNIFGIKRIFPNHVYPVFLMYMVFFLFYSNGTNGIRNACGFSIVFFAISLYSKPSVKNYILITLLCYLGYQFHSSVMVTSLSFLLALLVIKRTNSALIIWLGAILMSLAAGNFLAGYAAELFPDDRAADYLNSGDKAADAFMQPGFRWDFLIFSFLPIAVGYYVTEIRGIKDKFYQVLLNTYIIANAVWVVFIYAAFSNRFAMLSWCIYPYVLIYPYVKYKLWPVNVQNQNALTMLWIMLLFTTYMVF